MSTNKTENLGLHSWVETDPVLMSEFNENFAAIDECISALNSFAGNCSVVTGSYVGTGTVGAANTNSLIFPSEPVMVFIVPLKDYSVFPFRHLAAKQIFVPAIRTGMANSDNGYCNMSQISSDSGSSIYVKLSEDGTELIWYSTGSTAMCQSNDTTYSYFYCAFLK